MNNDWKEVEEPSEQCSPSNGWCGMCGMCGNCCEHAQWLHDRDSYEEQEG